MASRAGFRIPTHASPHTYCMLYDLALKNSTKHIFVVPGEWLNLAIVTADGNTGPCKGCSRLARWCQHRTRHKDWLECVSPACLRSYKLKASYAVPALTSLGPRSKGLLRGPPTWPMSHVNQLPLPHSYTWLLSAPTTSYSLPKLFAPPVSLRMNWSIKQR